MTAALESVSVLLADDHLAVAQGIQKLLKNQVSSIDVVPTGEELLAAVETSEPDLVLLDVGMPGISGFETLEQLRARGYRMPVVMLTMYEDLSLVKKAFSFGATAYVVKQACGEELLNAMNCAMRGERFVSPTLHWGDPAHLRGRIDFTEKQLAVLRLAADCLTAKQIAVELGISARTAESHKFQMMQALGVSTTVALIATARKKGVI